MASATVLLLLLAGSLLMGSTPVEGALFDYTLCKERLCLVNDDCSGTVSKNELMQYSDVKPCKILLAIWPYSEQKWRVTIETKFDAPNGVSLGVSDKPQNEKYKIVTCVKTSGGVTVDTKLPKYSTDLIGATHGADHFNCEFFLQTSEPKIPEHLKYGDKIELRYGTTTAAGWSIGLPTLETGISPLSGICNPDRIKYDKALAKPGQHVAPVNSDRFALTCPQDYDLMFGQVKARSIECVPTGADTPPRPHVYRITPLLGEVVDQLNKDFTAHCSQTACSLCKPIDCPTTPSFSSLSTTCPSFSKANAAVDGSCATLTCPGGRFSIDGGPATVTRAECTATGWRIGGRENVTRAVCSARVSCQAVAPLTCNDGSCTVDNGTLRCTDEGARLNTLNGTLLAGSGAVSLACDDTTGIWRATFDNGTTANATATPADYACGRVANKAVTGRIPWLKHSISVIAVVSFILGGLLLFKYFDRIHGLGDNDDPRITPELLALCEAEEAKEREAEERRLREDGSRVVQNSSDTTTGTKPTKRRRPKSERQKDKSEKEVKTAVPAPPTAPLLQPVQQQQTSLPRPSTQQQQHHVAPSSAEEQYEPIPGLAAEMVPEPGGAPAAPAALPVRASAPPPASSGPDSGQYEEIPQDPAGPSPPPPPPPAEEKKYTDDQYELIDPNSGGPRPPPTPGQQSLLQPVLPPPQATQSQVQQLQPAAGEKRASQYYANSAKEK